MRTWDDNRRAINQLWPLMEFTEEEKRLWHDDLSGLDQAVLYDAIRNVKRGNDTNYPQLKWVREEYRAVMRLRKAAERPAVQNAERHKPVVIDPAIDARMREELMFVVENATVADYKPTVDLICNKAHDLKIELGTATALCRYLRDRLGMSNGGDIGERS